MERFFGMPGWLGMIIKLTLMIAGQWVLWQRLAPDGCSSMGQYYLEECPKVTVFPGTLLLVASGGVVLLIDAALRSVAKRREARVDEG